MKKTLFLLSFFIYCSVQSQDLTNELYGFKLKQFRSATHLKFSEPAQKKILEDGFEYEIFTIKPDSTAYIIFEYAYWDKNSIWSIQIYGESPDIDSGFRNLKMGTPKKDIINQFGNPTKTEEIEGYGEIIRYEKTNFSFEFNYDNKLSGIKIRDIYSEFYPEQDIEKLPSFGQLIKTLQEKTNIEISKILSPGIEIYKGKDVLFFKNSWKSEVESDSSGIYSTIKNFSKSLSDINPNKSDHDLRLIEGQDPMHVYKFQKHPTLEEIVMKWELGKYLIWEIKLK